MIDIIKRKLGVDNRLFQQPMMGAKDLGSKDMLPYYIDHLKYFNLKDKYKDIQCPIVCVIDSGINFRHKDLFGMCAEQRDFSGEGLINLNDTHGSHVASIVSGDKFGLSSAKIADYKALDSRGSGSSYNIVRALRAAKKRDYQIISMSLGSDFPYSQMLSALRSITEKDDKKFVVCAAGNDGNRTTSDYPAEYSKIVPGVISISASDTNSNGDFVIASFSARQESVSFQGVQVIGVGAVHNGNHKFKLMSGTSMSTPGIAALLAVAKGIYPDFNQRDFHQIIDKSIAPIKGDDIGFLVPELFLENVEILAAENKSNKIGNKEIKKSLWGNVCESISNIF